MYALTSCLHAFPYVLHALPDVPVRHQLSGARPRARWTRNPRCLQILYCRYYFCVPARQVHELFSCAQAEKFSAEPSVQPHEDIRLSRQYSCTSPDFGRRYGFLWLLNQSVRLHTSPAARARAAALIFALISGWICRLRAAAEEWKAKGSHP